MTKQEIVNQVCDDLISANEIATTVEYGHWVSDNTGKASMCIDILDDETGNKVGEYMLELKVQYTIGVTNV